MGESALTEGAVHTQQTKNERQNHPFRQKSKPIKATQQKTSTDFRRHPIRQYLFLEQNSLYFCQKPRKATALLRFVASIQEIFGSYETAKHFKMRNSVARKDEKHR